MALPGRKFNQGTTKYRYGFNSHEKSDEIAGEGNHTTALFGEYDTRLVRRWNTDPRPDVSMSPYAMFSNNPIWFNDIALDTPRNAGNGALGQQFSFTNDGSLSANQFQQMQASFLGNLNQQMNNSGRTSNGNAISLNTSDPLASVINVTFGATGTSNANMAKSSMFISQADMSQNANVSTHEWLHTAGLMDRYYELYGRHDGDRETQTVESQRSGTVPMGILPPGHDNAHNATNMMASSGNQITQMQWNIVFNLGSTGTTEESLGSLGKVSFVYTYRSLNAASLTNRQSTLNSLSRTLGSNTNRIAFSSTTAYHMQRGAMLAVPNATFSDISPASLQRYIIHNRSGNVMGASLLLGMDWENKQLNSTIRR
jgi:hypothetical protein